MHLPAQQQEHERLVAEGAAAEDMASTDRGMAILEALLGQPHEHGSLGHSLLRSVLLLQALWPLTGRLV